MAKKVVKNEEIKNEEKCNCECNCGCNNKELVEYVKYSFYTLVCILVCVLIGTIFIIIIAVDNDKKNENKNTSSTYSSNSTQSGTQSGTDTSSDYDVSMFKEIDINGFMNLYNGSEKSVIYIGRSTCGYCVKFLPALQRAQEEFRYQTYYYDIDKLTAEDYYQIIALNSFMEENFTATPMVIVVQNGQILSANNDNTGWVGYNEYDAFKEYLIGLGF